MNMSTIQIWNSFDGIEIGANLIRNKFDIEIHEPAKTILSELEKKVDDNWAEVCLKNPLAKGGSILYLAESVKKDEEIIKIKTESREFKYTAAFNRNPDFQEMTKELSDYKLLSISTHCHLVTKDNKILFGTKKNQFNQISGFSGFPNVEEDVVEIIGKKYLDIYRTIKNRLRPEIDYLIDAIDSIKAIGVTYMNTPGLRGTDSDYVVYLDETSDKAEKRFKENAQFQKGLYVIDFEPEKIREFVKEINADNKVMSRYALGCIYLETKAIFGQEEADKLLNVVRKDLKVSITTSNETDYF